MSSRTKKTKAIDIPPATMEMLARCILVLKPPPELTLSAWADRYRMLSAESSAEPGRWHTDKAPYQREIMDAIGDPHVRKVIIMSAAQIGKTDAFILNTIGYYMDYAPAPMLVMQPTLDMGQTFSKDRLAPMLRDTPELHDKVDTKSRYSGNTILKKNFPGGHITIVGANSATGLASRPIKVLLADEVDRYPASAGSEGDPLSLAQKRQTTFWDKKTVMVSTPVIKGHSRIETEFNQSTREEWNVPCPECGHYQPLVWGGVKFNKDNLSAPVEYACERCGVLSSEYAWKKAGKAGRFVAENPAAEARGFHLNTLASTFCGWNEIVQKFAVAHEQLEQGNPEGMKVWVNTELGETWEEQGEQLEDSDLAQRREIYDAEVPDDVVVLTAGVDVQDDRFEVEVVGWGDGKESWGVRYQKIYGDLLKEQVWNDLDTFLLSAFYKKDGTPLRVLACCMDSGGHHANAVYSFCKERYDRRIFAIKGKGGAEVPYIRNPSTNNRVKVPLFILGVDAGKALLYQRLRHTTKGPNYCHFPAAEEAGYDELYFRGLTSEKLVTRFRKGRMTTMWVLKDEKYKRNEPLDLRNYATAALEIANPVLTKQDGTPPPKRQGRRRLNGGIG
jgi:phage terminase large subunit GpA-like protein